MTKNKFKPLVLLGLFLLIVGVSNSQSIVPQSINSGGAKMSQSNGSLSFTVGELIVITQTDSDGNTIGGGLIVGATITTVAIQEPNAEVLSVKVYPNPTTDLVNIKINYSTLEHVIVSITDLQGKEVYNGKYSGISNTIGVNTAMYATGTYMLSLKNQNNQVLGTYKIIKQ
jgi:hypothetical protein